MQLIQNSIQKAVQHLHLQLSAMRRSMPMKARQLKTEETTNLIQLVNGKNEAA